MLPSIKNIIKILDEVAPFELAEKWDNSGLQVGSRSQVVNKILVALDPTIEAIKRASSTGTRLLLTHHPLLFRPLSSIDLLNYPGNVIHEAIRNDVNIIAVHTNLDSAKQGINYNLAESLNLVDVEILEEKELNGENGYGIGVVGSLSEPCDLLSVSKMIKDRLNILSVKVAGSDDSIVSRIAVVGGSGGDYITAASRKNADLLVTGDIGHHDALTAKTLNINVIDAGHFSTERAALPGFIKKLDELFLKNGMDVVLELFEDETDPVRIL